MPCGDISAGAYDDIRRATDLARSMVTEFDERGHRPDHRCERQARTSSVPRSAAP
ncbi:MAG: hypothetical protein R3F34_17765 [Planctomycetota bacterium]